MPEGKPLSPIIETELLRTFITVVDTRSYTRAAAHLGLSQPTVSGHVKRLQEQVEVELFDKSAPGIKLTEQGEITLAYARQLMGIHDELRHRMDQRKSPAEEIRIGIPYELHCWTLVPALAEIRSSSPASVFDLYRANSEELLRHLQRGKIDLCAAVTADEPGPQAYCRWEDELVWASSREDGAGRPVELVAYPEGSIARQIMLAALQQANVSFRIVLSAPHIEGAIAAAKAGLGAVAMLRSNVSPPLAVLARDSGLPPLGAVYWGIYLHPGRRSELTERLADRIAGIIAAPNVGTASAR